MVGNRIRELRNERNMTLRELANDLGIAFTTLGNYERGDREPELEFIFKAAQYFGVSVDYITGFKDARNYDEFLLMNDFNILSEVLINANPEVKEQILKNISCFSALANNIARNNSLEEATTLSKIIEAIYEIKKEDAQFMGLSSSDKKFEYARKYIGIKQELSGDLDRLFNLYVEKNNS